jgi:hypothetical protein
MKKESAKRRRDDLRPEYDLARLKRGVLGKYSPGNCGEDVKSAKEVGGVLAARR